MWLNTKNNLCISKSRYKNILTRYRHEAANDWQEMQALKFALNHRECEEFLISKAATIETLKIQADDDESKNELNMEHLQLKVKSFKHVKKLVFCQIALTDEDLQVIGKNCRHLKSLHIIKCFCEHFRTLIPGVNMHLAEVCKMQQLQEFQMQPDKPPPHMEWLLKLEYVHLILSELQQLKHLNLKNFTITSTGKEKTDKAYWPLEVLHMGLLTFDFWSTFESFLKCCPYLSHLSIQATAARDIVINFEIIDILSIYCQNLQVLELENCEIDLKNFGDLQALQEVKLNVCRGLTFNNLQQLLGGLNLKVFKLCDTPVVDTGNLIYISPTLESITIDTEHFSEMSDMFQRSLNNFSNLKTLQWRNGDINHDWIAKKCPQLQKLHIANSYHLWQIVLNVKSLRELTITAIGSLSWNLLRNLIFKLSLKHLNIYSDCVIIAKNSGCQRSLMLPTTLESLAIPLRIFLVGVKYWLELLAVNKHLDFLIFGRSEDIINAKFISLLLATDCVRQRCNRIKICGFKLDLENFHNSTILREIAYAQINTNHYKEQKKPFTLEL